MRLLATPADADWRLWRIDLDALPGPRDACSEDEHARALRFRRPVLQARWLAAREGLRRVLGGALGCDPRALVFRPDAFGKPSITGPASRWHFNLSHSEGIALVGLREAGPIGVDVESMRAGASDPDLAERLFTPAEQASWRAAPALQRDAAFLRAWTRKEACMKALGVGLSLEPRFVDAGCDALPRDLAVSIAGRALPLQVRTVDAGPDAVAAVALASVQAAAEASAALAP